MNCAPTLLHAYQDWRSSSLYYAQRRYLSMATPVTEGMLLWEPSEEMKRQSNLSKYMQWLERERGLHFANPEELWAWSVDKLEDFWASLWDYFEIQASRDYKTVLVERKMPGAQWFP